MLFVFLLSYAVSLGCLPLLCAHIGSEDEELVHCVLQSFEVMLTTGSAEPVVKAMVETGGTFTYVHCCAPAHVLVSCLYEVHLIC